MGCCGFTTNVYFYGCSLSFLSGVVFKAKVFLATVRVGRINRPALVVGKSILETKRLEGVTLESWPVSWMCGGRLH